MTFSVLNTSQLDEIKKWFERKLESLERDSYRAFTDKIEVDHSLGKGAAPFPITLYCMSILDFFSATYIGYSEKGRDKNKLNQVQRMTKFLSEYMNYDNAVSFTALDVLRHKLVHLGEPHVHSKHLQNQLVGWQIGSYVDEGDHWQIKECDSRGNKALYFGVINFIKDLKEGILGQDGYFSNLTMNLQLQKNYLSFLKEIM